MGLNMSGKISDTSVLVIARNADKYFVRLGYEGKYPCYRRVNGTKLDLVDYTLSPCRLDDGSEGFRLVVETASASLGRVGGIKCAAGVPVDIAKAMMYRHDKSGKAVYRELSNLPTIKAGGRTIGGVDAEETKEFIAVIPAADKIVSGMTPELPEDNEGDEDEDDADDKPPAGRRASLAASAFGAIVWYIVFSLAWGYYGVNAGTLGSCAGAFLSLPALLSLAAVFLIILLTAEVRSLRYGRRSE